MEGNGSVVQLRVHPAGGERPADRCPGAGPRRDRAAAPGAGADDQGRHDPGDPPPGEEQPADRGRAAAAAGPADWRAGRPGRAGGGGAPGRVHRDRARDAVARSGGDRRLRRRAAAGGGHGGRGLGGRGPGEAGAARPVRPAARRQWPRRSPWCWPNCCRTPSSTAWLSAGARHGRAGWWWRSRAARTGSRSRVEDNGVGLPDGFEPRLHDQPGLADRAHPGRVGARGSRHQAPLGEVKPSQHAVAIAAHPVADRGTDSAAGPGRTGKAAAG